MKCPKCGSNNVYVKDSRREGDLIKRRRSCADCGHRFGSVEVAVEQLIAVPLGKGTIYIISEM